jgi:Raf kinase inhibitor-like YbhB/YbcL family protein
MNLVRRGIVSIGVMGAVVAVAMAHAPQGGGQRGAAGAGGRGGAPRTVLSVTSPAWPDGGEIPMKHAYRGENRSPAFEFRWTQADAAVSPPDGLRTYAVVFHDIENSSNRGTADTLHWTLFNIPGTAKGLSEGLGAGDLPDGSRNGPGLSGRGGAPRYFGPGAGQGPFHHYVFEFFALDVKLDLPAAASREELMNAMEGHVIGKSAYVGRFRTP